MYGLLFLAIFAGASQSSLDSQLYKAATDEDLVAIKAALEGGANIDAQTVSGATALYGAVINGDKEVVKYLISRGANLEIQARDGSGTMLFYAVRYDYPAIVRILLEAGANVNATDQWYETPLDIAKSRGHAEIARILESAGGKAYWVTGLKIFAVVAVLSLGTLLGKFILVVYRKARRQHAS